MPRVLIAGCGYLGSTAGDLFREAGWEIEGWTKSSKSADALSDKPYAVKTVDVTDRTQVMEQHGNWDVVIQCVSTRGGDVADYRQVYLAGTQNLIDRFVGSTILLTSSTSVYAQQDGEIVTEESAAEPLHERGQVLREAEDVVLKNGGIVARLAGIYGPGRSALLKKCLTGETEIHAGSDRFVNQIHRDDGAAALFLLASRAISARPGASRIFNVVDDYPAKLSEVFRWLLSKVRVSAPTRVPSTVFGKRGRSNKRVQNAKLRELGWEPRYRTFIEGFEKSVFPSFGVPSGKS